LLIFPLFSCPLPFPFLYLLLLGCRGNEINLVLWGARAHEFEAEEVRAASESGAVIAIFVGALPKQYRGDCLVYLSLVASFIMPA